MPNICKMYSATWRQIVEPCDKPYSENELGPESGAVGGQRYTRETHRLRNIKGQSLFVALFVPVDAEQPAADAPEPGPQACPLEDRRLDAEFGLQTFESRDCVVFLHAHNSNSLQGLFLKEWVLLRGKALCLFDFHGAGHSEGRYSSLGYFETLDLDAVPATHAGGQLSVPGEEVPLAGALGRLERSHLRDPLPLARVPQGHRQARFAEPGEERHLPRWPRLTQTPVASCAACSTQPCPRSSRPSRTQSAASPASCPSSPQTWPSGCSRVATGHAESIREHAKFSLSDVEPRRFIKEMLVPAHFILGSLDRFVVQSEFDQMFLSHPLVKALKLNNGGHAAQLEQPVIADAIRFILKMTDDPDTVASVVDMREAVCERLAGAACREYDRKGNVVPKEYRWDRQHDSDHSPILRYSILTQQRPAARRLAAQRLRDRRSPRCVHGSVH